MNRHLDGVYFRVEREGRYKPVCFSDLTEEEMKRVTENRTKEWLANLCIHLAKTMKEIGDTFDIISTRGEE